ncbi:hypothetical protein ANN_20457 [Periplaneta americana]|uniref:Uncharacterized protein n=1 Tax=Periplaneta americana TaxID=6978 RepID=A0ABQ8SDF0_PERAM|nr:hypothetical protein ANN_20457 [Periplaneta americana]
MRRRRLQPRGSGGDRRKGDVCMPRGQGEVRCDAKQWGGKAVGASLCEVKGGMKPPEQNLAEREVASNRWKTPETETSRIVISGNYGLVINRRCEEGASQLLVLDTWSENKTLDKCLSLASGVASIMQPNECEQYNLCDGGINANVLEPTAKLDIEIPDYDIHIEDGNKITNQDQLSETFTNLSHTTALLTNNTSTEINSDQSEQIPRKSLKKIKRRKYQNSKQFRKWLKGNSDKDKLDHGGSSTNSPEKDVVDEDHPVSLHIQPISCGESFLNSSILDEILSEKKRKSHGVKSGKRGGQDELHVVSPLHFHNEVRTFLNDGMPNRWIVCVGRDDMQLLSWPPRSPDLPCDFYLWRYVKDSVFVPPLSENLPELQARIINTIAAIDMDTRSGLPA